MSFVHISDKIKYMTPHSSQTETVWFILSPDIFRRSISQQATKVVTVLDNWIVLYFPVLLTSWFSPTAIYVRPLPEYKKILNVYFKQDYGQRFIKFLSRLVPQLMNGPATFNRKVF